MGERTLGETGTEETGDLLDERLRGQESIVALRELLDELLVLVQPLRGVFAENCTRNENEAITHFFKSSTDLYSRSICLARSMSAASARMQMDMRGRGIWGSLGKRGIAESVEGD